MHIETESIRLNIPNFIIIIFIALVILFGYSAKRYFDNKNYDWSGLYAVKNCEGEDSHCMVLITKSAFGFQIGDGLSNQYKASGNIWNSELVDLDDFHKIGFFDFFQETPKDIHKLLMKETEQNEKYISLQSKKFFRVHNDGLEKILYKINNEKFDENYIRGTRYKYGGRSLYAKLEQGVWQTDKGEKLYLNINKKTICTVHTPRCSDFILTKGNLQSSIIIERLARKNEHTFDKKLNLQHSSCNNEKNQKNVISIIFDDNYQPKELVLTINDKQYVRKLKKLQTKENNSKFYSYDDIQLMKMNPNYDGCNNWQLPN